MSTRGEGGARQDGTARPMEKSNLPTPKKGTLLFLWRQNDWLALARLQIKFNLARYRVAC